jgi:hypothetical protein
MLLQQRQLYRAAMLSFLDVVPHELFFQPGRLFFCGFNVLTGAVVMDRKPLATLIAENGLHQNIIGALRPVADAPD